MYCWLFKTDWNKVVLWPARGSAQRSDDMGTEPKDLQRPSGLSTTGLQPQPMGNIDGAKVCMQGEREYTGRHPWTSVQKFSGHPCRYIQLHSPTGELRQGWERGRVAAFQANHFCKQPSCSPASLVLTCFRGSSGLDHPVWPFLEPWLHIRPLPPALISSFRSLALLLQAAEMLLQIHSWPRLWFPLN